MNKKKINELGVGDSIDFPIRFLRTVRNVVSELNTIHYLENKKWESETIKEKGIIIARRVS